MAQADDKLVKREDLKVLPGPNSFAALLKEKGDEIRRDVWMLLDPEETASNRLQSGITVVYPGCTTSGHDHPDREEIYFFTKGKGLMIVDGREFEVSEGDLFYVKPGPKHTTRNPHDANLEFFWTTVRWE